MWTSLCGNLADSMKFQIMVGSTNVRVGSTIFGARPVKKPSSQSSATESAPPVVNSSQEFEHSATKTEVISDTSQVEQLADQLESSSVTDSDR